MILNHSTHSTNTFFPEEKEKIIKNIFLDKSIPNPSIFYQGEGKERYDKVSKSPEYRANRVEEELFRKNAETLSKYIKDYVTDVGCGNGEKAVAFLSAILPFLHAKKKLTYIASESSATMIELAEQNIKRAMMELAKQDSTRAIPEVNIGNHQVIREGNDLFTNALQKNTYLCLGFLLGDFSNPGMVEELKKMSNRGTLKGNDIIFSYFEVPENKEEEEKTIGLYDNKIGKGFIFNGLENIGIDTSYFDHMVEYDPKDHCVYISIKAKKSYPIMVEGKSCVIQEGFSYRVYQSRRFTKEEISVILKEIGCKKLEHFSQEGISLVVAKQAPKYYKKSLQTAAVIL